MLGGVLSVAVARFLAGRGLVSYQPPTGPVLGAGVPAFVEDLPDGPDDAVGIYTLGGTEPADALGYVAPVIQIVRRGGAGSARAPQTHARQIRRALHDLTETVIAAGTDDAVEVLLVTAIDAHPANRGFSRDRPMWSVNVRIEYQED